MQRSLGWIMLLAGIFMLIVSIAFPMVTLIGDNTPPTWGTASDGTIALSPRDGDVRGSLVTSVASVLDPESGVASVTMWIDGTIYYMSLTVGTIHDGVWGKSGLSIATGTHTIKYTATNKVDLSTTYTGSFKIYTALQGNWYVNDILITSPTQEVWSKSTTFAFKFVKTTGIADSSITCTGWEGGVKIFTFANTAANTWSDTCTFSLGKHTIDLKASDGTETITMSIFNFYVGDKPIVLPQLNMLQIFGLASTGIGLLLIFTGKKVAGKKH